MLKSEWDSLAWLGQPKREALTKRKTPGIQEGSGTPHSTGSKKRKAQEIAHMWRSVPAPTQGAGVSTIPGAGGPPPPPNVTSNRRLQQTQAQVDEVVDIMRVNVDKVLERDQKLSELDNRADALQAGASQFETSAAKLKRKYWWKNCKMMIILGVVCAVILIVMIIYFCT
ncbi:vesicle-associated membrane protein 2-like isoform X2 [Mauremys mutica]|uniref:vesicle-associated membrane protein 2-like isoform X2 n=1 Tax=Mauremys mutica TaxID=74926 RepID=UPI001D15F4C1|nr:vesicle-associated membrane protein 2-like isoform X2 [Mauremys mutica]